MRLNRVQFQHEIMFYVFDNSVMMILGMLTQLCLHFKIWIQVFQVIQEITKSILVVYNLQNLEALIFTGTGFMCHLYNEFMV